MQSKPNVLMIAVDDLNDWIGCLGGHPDAQTPHMDRLAQRSVLFTNAHCQGTMCNPSRISIMWGMRPSTTGFYSNHFPVHKSSSFLKKYRTLTSHFNAAGYKTMTAGKVYHASWLPENDFQVVGPRPGQSTKLDRQVWQKPRQYHKIWDFGPQHYDEREFVDYKIASWGEKELRKTHARPFFIAMGFMRPHVPFYPPIRIYRKMGDVGLPTVIENDWDDLSQAAWEVTLSNQRIPKHDWMRKEHRWQLAVKAYLSCVAWVDEQIGRTLEALESGPNRTNTIVVFYTDHGYHLGEKERWSKFSLWERTTRVPLMISVPEKLGNKTGSTHQSVELLSLYPTLLELCGLTADAQIKDQVEGHSLVPLLKDLEGDWPHVAISTLGQHNHAIKDQRWRYIRYVDGSEELYDHEHDPYEWRNLALNKAQEAQVVIARLKRHLPKVNVSQRKK